MTFECAINLTGYDFKFLYGVSVTINKIDLLIAIIGNNGTDVSYIAY